MAHGERVRMPGVSCGKYLVLGAIGPRVHSFSAAHVILVFSLPQVYHPMMSTKEQPCESTKGCAMQHSPRSARALSLARARALSLSRTKAVP